MPRTSEGRPRARACRIASRLVNDTTWRFFRPAGRLRSAGPMTIVCSSANQRAVTVPALSRRRSDESADMAMSQYVSFPMCKGSTDEDAVGLVGATVGLAYGDVADVGGEGVEAPGLEAPGLE